MPYLETYSGDLFSLAWSPTRQVLFVGCQNTSLQWISFPSPSSSPPPPEPTSSGTATPTHTSRKAHKFFDSYPIYQRKPADLHAYLTQQSGRDTPDLDCSDITPPNAYFSIPACNVIDSAHWGYIYCMVVLDDEDGVRLATGSGDEFVKVSLSAEPGFWS
jgi:di- and tripeptidase